MIPLRYIVFPVCLALAACAQPSQRPDSYAQAPAPAKGEAKSPRVVIAKPEPRKPPLPAVDLSEDFEDDDS